MYIIFSCAFFSTLCIFDVIQRVGALFGRKGIEYTEYLFNKTLLLCLKITGASFHYSYEGSLHGPTVFISNHQSMFDIPCVFVGARHLAPRFVSKIELAKGIPGVSICLTLSQAALIDRKDPTQALPEIQRFGRFIKQIRMSAVIFPEGTRAKDGILKKFKKKGSESLIKECFPCWVTPVCIDGSWKFQKNKRGPIPLGTKVHVAYLEPIKIDDESQIRSALQKAEDAVIKKLDELRKE